MNSDLFPYLLLINDRRNSENNYEEDIESKKGIWKKSTGGARFINDW